MMNIPEKMPAIFVGHGSPMNAIENNRFTQTWQSLPSGFQKPKAILSVSAHWVTNGTCVNDLAKPETIYDMYGFPQALYEHTYPTPGSPWLAEKITQILGNSVGIDNRWGIDHGTWSVMTHMFPHADIPTMQISLDFNASMADHYRMGRQLSGLREQGVLILGSGNVVHNLSLVDWKNQGGEMWADEFDLSIKQCILNHDHKNVIDYRNVASWSPRVFATTEHFVPLLFVLGSSLAAEPINVFNEERVMGSISMTGYQFG